jgi:LuxR family maltose regulon positive regulatory protein
MSSAIDVSQVLRTKLYRPRTPDSLVDRPRLLDRLDAQRHRPLTLVSAAAGYGKTTLVSSWLDKSEFPTAWLSLDDRDNDLALFLTYFVAAVQTVFPKAGRETLAMLNTSTLPPATILAHSLINELDQLEPAFVLVLDDFHLILGTAIHDLLTELLRHPPRPLHLVIISRTDPSLPLATLRVQNQVTEIRTRDLRFTAEETASLAQQMQGVAFDQATLANLVDTTEGWASAVHLALLATRDQSDLESVLGNLPDRLHGHIADYLTAEVVSRQPAAIREFLLQTSILDWLNDPLCAAVAEPVDPTFGGRTYLEWLRAANLFIVTLDEHQESYRYHPLFQEYLREQLERSYSPPHIKTLHARASAWYADHGLIDEALRHAMAAGDSSGAAHLVVVHRHTLLIGEQFLTLERWLDSLPQEVIERDVDLLLTRTWLMDNRFRHAEIPPLLEQAALVLGENADLTDRERAVLGGEIALLWAILFYHMGQGQLSVENAEHAIEVTPIENEWVYGEALTFRAGAYQLVGQLDRAYEEIRKIVTAGGQAGVFIPRAYGALMLIEMLAGNLSGLEQAAQRQVNLTESRLLYMSLGWARLVLGHVYYQRNDLARAHQEFTQVVELRYRTHDTVIAHGCYGKALCLQAQGKPGLAQEASQAAIDLAMETDNAYLLLEAESFASRLALLQGEALDINRWVAPVGDEIPVMVMPHIPHLTLANVLLAQGTPQALQEASELLARLRLAAESTYNTWRLMEVTAMQALLKAAQGKRQDALATLEQAIVWAEPRGYIRLFADLGPQMVGLLDVLRRQGVAPDYVAQILAAIPPARFETTAPSTDQYRDGNLTKRERQVLQLLATDLSAEDVASEMVVSVATIRTHCRRIYSKLDAHSRFEAVQRAQELDLL